MNRHSEFDIHGDKIIFRGFPVAHFDPACVIGRRIDAENELLALVDPDGMVTDDDHYKAVQEAEESGHAAGFEEGREQGQRECEERNRETWEAEAFKHGRDSALHELGRLEDFDRLRQFVDDVIKIYDRLAQLPKKFAPDPSQDWKRRFGTSAELREQARSIATDLRLLLSRFEAGK